jgi:hypothetical protein
MRTALWSLALAACAPSAAAPPEGCEADVEIGTGVVAFEPLEEGMDFEFVHGNQGGYHLPLAARTCDVDDPGFARFVARLEDTDEVVCDVPLSRAWTGDGACCEVMLDIVGYLSAPRTSTGYTPNYTPFDPASIDGRSVVITAQVTDGAEDVHEASVAVVVHQP